ncbi:hypothetical protein GCM10029963_32660 [Micromonospora andamanensis]
MSAGAALTVSGAFAYALRMSTTHQDAAGDRQGLVPDSDPNRPLHMDWQRYAGLAPDPGHGVYAAGASVAGAGLVFFS